MSKPSLISNALIVNGTTKNPDCYNSFNNAEVVMELLTKYEGRLENITVCCDTSSSAAVNRLMQYFLLRARLGIKYPVKEIWLETENDKAWENIGRPLKEAGYGVSLHGKQS